MEKRFTTVLGVVAAFIIGALAMWLWFKPTIDMVQDSQKVWQQRLLHCEANQVDALTERREVVSCPKKLAALKREIWPLQESLRDTKKALAFYEQYVDKKNHQNAIVIDSIEVLPISPSSYWLRVAILQYADKSQFQSGEVRVKIQLDDEMVVLEQAFSKQRFQVAKLLMDLEPGQTPKSVVADLLVQDQTVTTLTTPWRVVSVSPE